MAIAGLTTHEGATCCTWRTSAPEYRHYHDHEWGVPVGDDTQLFEKICLEGFQAGLAWITILRKREDFRRAFEGFDYRRMARYTEEDIQRVLADPGIVRNRAKVVSAVNNARRACELVEECGSLARWLWAFEPAADERPALVDMAYWTTQTTSPASVRLSKALKKRGWTFVGPTTMHALMQAMGMVNDHLEGCACRPRIEHLRQQFKRP